MAAELDISYALVEFATDKQLARTTPIKNLEGASGNID
jgi:hypothetical protein